MCTELDGFIRELMNPVKIPKSQAESTPGKETASKVAEAGATKKKRSTAKKA
jgi:hypothetical protein